ncbi:MULTISPECIES: hypothetical protein [unclassified Bradyrhizobium]
MAAQRVVWILVPIMAGGVPMDPYEQFVPAKIIEAQAALKEVYPEFWPVGTARGIANANEEMKGVADNIFSKMCAFLKAETIKRMD